MLRFLAVAGALSIAVPAAAQDAPAEPRWRRRSAPATELISAPSSLPSPTIASAGVSAPTRIRRQAAINLNHSSGSCRRPRHLRWPAPTASPARPGLPGSGEAELDLYAGYGAQPATASSLDAGLFTISSPAATAPRLCRALASLSYLIGPSTRPRAPNMPPRRMRSATRTCHLFGQVDVSTFRPWRFSARSATRTGAAMAY